MKSIKQSKVLKEQHKIFQKKDKKIRESRSVNNVNNKWTTKSNKHKSNKVNDIEYMLQAQIIEVIQNSFTKKFAKVYHKDVQRLDNKIKLLQQQLNGIQTKKRSIFDTQRILNQIERISKSKSPIKNSLQKSSYSYHKRRTERKIQQLKLTQTEPKKEEQIQQKNQKNFKEKFSFQSCNCTQQIQQLQDEVDQIKQLVNVKLLLCNDNKENINMNQLESPIPKKLLYDKDYYENSHQTLYLDSKRKAFIKKGSQYETLIDDEGEPLILSEQENEYFKQQEEIQNSKF